MNTINLKKTNPVLARIKRARFIAEETPKEGKLSFRDLPQLTKEFIYWTNNVVTAQNDLRAAETEKSFIYEMGYTADTFDFVDLNTHIINMEDRLHEATQKYNIVKEAYFTNLEIQNGLR